MKSYHQLDVPIFILTYPFQDFVYLRNLCSWLRVDNYRNIRSHHQCIPHLVYMAVTRNHQYRYYKPYRYIYRQHKPCHIGMDGKIPLPTFWFILLSCWECWRCYSRDIFMRSFTSPFAIWKKFFPCTNCLLWEGNVHSTFRHLKREKLISTDINLMRKSKFQTRY